ncbi:hypothetical protein [Martelella radicis]|nr:hypothetical protein [Martelella radicis]
MMAMFYAKSVHDIRRSILILLFFTFAVVGYGIDGIDFRQALEAIGVQTDRPVTLDGDHLRWFIAGLAIYLYVRLVMLVPTDLYKLTKELPDLFESAKAHKNKVETIAKRAETEGQKINGTLTEKKFKDNDAYYNDLKGLLSGLSTSINDVDASSHEFCKSAEALRQEISAIDWDRQPDEIQRLEGQLADVRHVEEFRNSLKARRTELDGLQLKLESHFFMAAEELKNKNADTEKISSAIDSFNSAAASLAQIGSSALNDYQASTRYDHYIFGRFVPCVAISTIATLLLLGAPRYEWLWWGILGTTSLLLIYILFKAPSMHPIDNLKKVLRFF